MPFFAVFLGGITPNSKGINQLNFVFAKSLACVFIPLVIIYNMTFYQSGSFSLIGFSFFCSIFIYLIFVRIYNNKLTALCASYINIGWLGFPFALVIFGHQVSTAMIALYIGGSLFGNVWAIRAVSTHNIPLQQILKKVMLSPPVIALMISAVLSIFHLQKNDAIEQIYQLAKLGMVFSGMFVLGVWLRRTTLTLIGLWQSAKILMLKVVLGMLICTVIYYFTDLQPIMLLMFLFCLPPAANIVALETNYQGTGTSAQDVACGTVVSLVAIFIFWTIKTMLIHGL